MDCNTGCSTKTVDEKIPLAKNLVNLWSREVAIATNFVELNGETPSLFVLAFYNGWEDHKTYTHTETLYVPSTSCKYSVHFSAANH